MKKTVVFIILIMILSVCHVGAQSRLGVKKIDLVNEFNETGYEIQYKTTSYGVPYVKVISKLASVIYYFDENEVCKMCILFPTNSASLTYFKDQYNRKYMVATPTKWISNSNGVKSIIELVYTKQGGYFFVWHE